jgi:hypothetical protein
MATSELLAPFLIAEGHRKADDGRIARAARMRKPERPRPEVDDLSWMPRLRNWPWDATFPPTSQR